MPQFSGGSIPSSRFGRSLGAAIKGDLDLMTNDNDARDGKKPSSPRKVRANRENARRSTGPKTPRGKSIVSRNAFKHGLTARDFVVPEVDGEEGLQEFMGVLDALAKDHRAALKQIAAAELASCFWKLGRARRCETEEIAGSRGTEWVLKAMEKFLRYEIQLRRQLRKTMEWLAELDSGKAVQSETSPPMPRD